jgi:DNA-binding CsgD family transcriptional regulator
VLIGRERELERLLRALETARGGGSDVLVVRGEAGMGKTALLQALVAAADGMTVLRARGVESEVGVPFAALAELCEPVLALRERLPDAQAAALAGALQLEPVAPQARLAIGAALLGLLSLAAEEQPVVCVVDDAQWVDEPSLDALRFATRRLGDGGVAVVLTRRPPNGDDDIEEALELGPLDAKRAVELLQAGRDRPVPEAVARRVLETAAGNPLALLEIPAVLSPAELGGQAPLEGPLPLGSTLERVLARRLRALPEGTRQALLVAAAADVRRGDVVLGALAAAGLDVAALEPAESAGIVSLGPGEIAFRHPLLRAASYHEAGTVARRAAHRAVAQALPPEDPRRAWQLASAAALPDEQVAEVLERAAQAARASGGFASAAHAHLRAAELSPDPRQRARRLVAAARDLLRAQAGRLEADAPTVAGMLLLLSSLGGMALRDHPGWLMDAERAVALAGEVELLAALSLLSAGAARMTVPDVAEGRRLLAEGERRLGNDIALALSLAPEVVALGAHGWLWIEEYQHGVEVLDRLVAAGRDAVAVGALPYPLAARAQGNLALGRYGQALADAEEAVALAEQTGQDPALVIALGMLAAVRAWRGDEPGAVAAAERALELGERRRVPLPAIYARYALGTLSAALGRPEEAIRRLEIVRVEALPGNVLWAPHLVDAYVRGGRHDDAARLVEHYARNTEHRRIAPAMLERLRGMIAPPEEAEAHFRRALELHGAGPAPFEVARTQLAYGEWLRAVDRRDEAREQLREALVGFERAGALPFAERARRELRAAGAIARAPERSDEAELTAHEVRVAQLVAQGLTNRETAAALFVSTKTVEHHLRNVFRKLGIRRRAELARRVATGSW